jgi:hypothetical protein
MPPSLTLNARVAGVLDELRPHTGLYPRTGLFPNSGGIATKTAGALSLTTKTAGSLTLTPNS